MGERSSGQEAVGRFPVISKLSPFSTKLDERRELCFAMKYDYGVQRLYKKYPKGGESPNISFCSAAFTWLALHGQ